MDVLEPCSHAGLDCTHRWTDDQIALLRRLAPTTSHAEIGRQLLRSTSAVRAKAQKLGIRGRDPDLGMALQTPADRERIVAALASSVRTGEDNPNWRGGTVKRFYNREFRRNRELIYERDAWTCQHPGCRLFSPSGLYILAHHIVPIRFTRDNRTTNLVTLCEEHHHPQPAHWWTEFTIELEDTLPYYQRHIRLDGLVA